MSKFYSLNRIRILAMLYKCNPENAIIFKQQIRKVVFNYFDDDYKSLLSKFSVWSSQAGQASPSQLAAQMSSTNSGNTGVSIWNSIFGGQK